MAVMSQDKDQLHSIYAGFRYLEHEATQLVKICHCEPVAKAQKDLADVLCDYTPFKILQIIQSIISMRSCRLFSYELMFQ